MKFLIVFVALFAAACAVGPEGVQIVRSESNVNPDSYNYAYETSDGTAASQEGQLQNVGSDHEAISVHGQYQYVSPEGQPISVQYVADEHGFQPTGAHIPA